MIRALFIGGSWDGQWRDVAGARRHIVPVVKSQSAEGLPPPRTYHEIIHGENIPMAPMEVQTYAKRVVRNDDGSLNRVEYVLEPVE